jgi:hypothetical protein
MSGSLVGRRKALQGSASTARRRSAQSTSTPMSRRTASSRESITSNRTESADPLNASESLSAPGQTRVTILLTSSIHAAPWVVICAAKYLNLQFPTRLITSRSQGFLAVSWTSSIVWANGVKIVLRICGILFILFNIYAITHYDLRHLPSCPRVFYSANGLLIGTAITSAMLLWLDREKTGRAENALVGENPIRIP